MGIQFPYIHDLAQLLALVEQAGRAVPERVRGAAALSDYAVEARYPGLGEPVTREEYEQAVVTATAVLNWVQGEIEVA